MNGLEQNLCAQFGIQSCLTGSQLTYDTPTLLRPSTTLHACSSDRVIDEGFLDESKIPMGSSNNSLGCYPENHNMHNPNYGGLFVYIVVKKSQTPQYNYILPDQLDHLTVPLQIMIDDHYSTVQFPETYICGLMHRSFPLLESGQTAENWHVHKNFSHSTVSPERLERLEVSDEDIKIVADVAPDMVAHEYLTSNRLGTLIQTKQPTKPFTLTETDGNYTVIDDTQMTGIYRQCIDREITQSSAYVFHRAASVPKKMVGLRRDLLLVSFLPTIRTRQAFLSLG